MHTNTRKWDAHVHVEQEQHQYYVVRVFYVYVTAYRQKKSTRVLIFESC